MTRRIVIGNQRHAKFVNGLMNLVASLVDSLADFVAGLIERLAHLVAGLGDARRAFRPVSLAIRRPASPSCTRRSPVQRLVASGVLRRGEWCDATIHDTTITRTIKRKNRFIVVQSHSG